MSEFINYNQIMLGEAEQLFLYLVGRMEPSVYTVFSFMKRHNKISYKNTHKTFMKLQKLGLIQRKGTFLRNAIRYRLTPKGVFQFLLTCEIDRDFLLVYRDYPILQLILYPFFEVQTIKYFDTTPREYFMSEYIKNSCDRILEHLEEFRKFYGPKVELNAVKLERELGGIVRTQIMPFIYSIVALNTSRMRFTTEYQSGENDSYDYVINEGGDYPNYPYKDATKVVHEEKAKDKNYCMLFPTEILMKDKKFMSFFREMKKEFEDGCKQFTAP